VNSPHPDDSLRARLHYADDEPARLDVAAMVARGTRIRHRRLLTRVSAVALACAVVPVTVAAATSAGPGQAAAQRTIASPRRATGGAVHAAAGRAGTGSDRTAFGANSGIATGAAGARSQSAGQNDYNAAGRAPGIPATAQGRQVRTRVGVSARLTQGAYDPINNLVGDSSADGVWFWGLSRTSIKLFRLSRTGHLRAWTVLPSSEKLIVGGVSGFTVTRDGVAWFGLNSTLVRFDTTTGHARTWAIPAPRPNTWVEKHWPSPLRHQLTAQSLAVSASGEVAVAESGDASSAQVLDPATGHFSQVTLPSTYDMPQAVGFTRNGTLGVAYAHVGPPQGSGVVLAPAAGPVISRKVADAFGVAPYGATGLLVGASKPDVVSASGVVSPLIMPVSAIGYTGDGTGPAALKGDRLASVLGDAILSFPANATSVASARAGSVLYLLPKEKCLPDEPGGGPGRPTATASPAPATCHLPIESLATDKGGDLWVVVATGNPDVVDLLVPR
jgi:hypothetical protein